MEYRKREVAETETIGRMELARQMESVGRTELAGKTKRNKMIERKNTEPMKQCGKYSTILSHPYPSVGRGPIYPIERYNFFLLRH